LGLDSSSEGNVVRLLFRAVLDDAVEELEEEVDGSSTNGSGSSTNGSECTVGISPQSFAAFNDLSLFLKCRQVVS
jgi:hypothetical protein